MIFLISAITRFSIHSFLTVFLSQPLIYADTLTEVGRVVDVECHSAYVEYLCITDCDKDSVKLQEGETSDYRWVDRETLLNMKKNKLITERMELFINELKG